MTRIGLGHRHLALLVAVPLVAACAAGATTTPAVTPAASAAATSTADPTPTAAPTPKPPVTPAPTTDATGPERVTGTEGFTRIERGEVTTVGEVMQLRGNEVDTVDTMNDARVTGTGTVHGDADMYGSTGTQWGTYRLENAGGAWEGTWTGILTEGGAITEATGWLVGSGGYEGYTYYFHHYGSGTLELDGFIFPGSPPAP